jgi:hypothetical protein
MLDNDFSTENIVSLRAASLAERTKTHRLQEQK